MAGPALAFTINKQADRSHLRVKVKDPSSGKWRNLTTPFLPGQEDQVGPWLEANYSGPTPEQHTVRSFARSWLVEREQNGVRDVENDTSRLEHHVYPIIGDLPLDAGRAKHIVTIVDRLKKSGHAPRTIRNVYSVVKALFRDARIEDLVTTDPCILTARQLGKLRDADLGWRAGAVFTRPELAALIGNNKLPLDRRVLHALLGVGMLRTGEACGLRWSAWQKAQPLEKLIITRSYDHDTTKTEAERWMPVHEALSTLLWMWREVGWKDAFGRAPTSEDLVLPCPMPTNRGPRKPFGAMRDKEYVYKRWLTDLTTLGLRHRRVHDLRRTGISFAIEDGAIEDILKRGTHAPPRHVMGLYTQPAWEAVCREVEKLDLFKKPAPPKGPKVRTVPPPTPKLRTVSASK